MSSKTTAILAVLLLSFCSLFVLINADVEGDYEESISLKHLLEGPDKDKHWAKATESSNILTISNNDIAEPLEDTVLRIEFTDNHTYPYDKIVFADGFKIPKDHKVCTYGYDVYFTNLIIEGTLSHENSNSVLISTDGAPSSITLNGGAITHTDNRTMIKMDGEIKGSDCSLNCQISSKNLNITVDGDKPIRLAETIITSDSNDDWSFKLNDCYLSNKDSATGKISLSTGAGPDNGASKITLSGNLYGLAESAGRVTFRNNSGVYVDIVFDELSMAMIQFDYSNNTLGSITFGSKTGYLNYSSNVIFVSDAIAFFRSLSGNVFLSICIGIDHTTVTTCQMVCNENGPQNKMCGVMLAGLTHVESVSAEDGKQVVFFSPYESETVDLTKVKVTCEKGYMLTGWYELDDKGIMKKIDDPEHYAPTDFTTVYAMAGPEPEPEPEPVKDATTLPIVLTAVMLGVALIIGMFVMLTRRY